MKYPDGKCNGCGEPKRTSGECRNCEQLRAMGVTPRGER